MRERRQRFRVRARADQLALRCVVNLALHELLDDRRYLARTARGR